MNVDSSSTLRLGAQIGFTQKRLDYRDLQFDRQYNGQVFDPGLSNQENISNVRVAHPDVNLGVQFIREGRTRRKLRAGLSLFNMTTPDESFGSSTPSPLDLRLLAHTEVIFPITDDWDAMPAAQVMSQGTYKEILLGSRFRYNWRDDAIGTRRAWIGGFARLADGAFVTVGADYDAWQFGLSYDINLSQLDIASNRRGGFELSVIYILDIFSEKRKRHRACPAWL